MRKLLALATIAAAVLAISTPSQAASFNCNGRVTVTEAVICQNPSLSALDSKMAAAYFSELNAQPKVVWPVIRREQTSWLRTRNSCGANVGCLKTAYHTRISQLTGIGY